MSEHDEQVAVVDWWALQYPKIYNCLFSIPNGASLWGNKWQKAKQMQALKAEGLLPGVSDLMLIVPSGEYVGMFLEMKNKNKTRCSVSKTQWDFIQLAREHGYHADWYAGADNAIESLKAYMEGKAFKMKE